VRSLLRSCSEDSYSGIESRRSHVLASGRDLEVTCDAVGDTEGGSGDTAVVMMTCAGVLGFRCLGQLGPH
jgi:hypothetical protein